MKLRVVTIEGIILDCNAQSITLPTQVGVITILEDHQPLLSIIEPGVIEVITNTGTKQFLSVSKGIINVKRNNIINILADTAEKAEHIDIKRAKEAKRKAEKILEEQENLADIEFSYIQAKLAKELARIEAKNRWKNKK
jgi:F-type H+-transporting ATPase subunit epsilon